MKAYLKYGKFTQFIDITKIVPTIVLMKPPVVYSYPGNESNKFTYNKLSFEYMRTETISGDDVAIYEFNGEV